MAQARNFSMAQSIAEVFAGLSITAEQVHDAELTIPHELHRSSTDELIAFCGTLLAHTKPMLVVGNKVDAAPTACTDALKGDRVVFASAASELALRKAVEGKLIRYLPGDATFSIENESALSPAQKAGIARIGQVMKEWSGTGVQQALNAAVFSMLDMIVVYPVEDESKFTDSQGRVLPDAFLMRRGSTPRDLAFRVHTDIGKGFLYAVDARTRMRIKDNYVMRDGDVIKIVSTRK
jgi:ribosome-binding ATPase YchF (GTP1/OBG family)